MLALVFATDFKEKGHTKRSAFVYPKALYFYIKPKWRKIWRKTRESRK